jgi:hypothetical protein
MTLHTYTAIAGTFNTVHVPSVDFSQVAAAIDCHCLQCISGRPLSDRLVTVVHRTDVYCMYRSTPTHLKRGALYEENNIPIIIANIASA